MYNRNSFSTLGEVHKSPWNSGILRTRLELRGDLRTRLETYPLPCTLAARDCSGLSFFIWKLGIIGLATPWWRCAPRTIFRKSGLNVQPRGSPGVVGYHFFRGDPQEKQSTGLSRIYTPEYIVGRSHKIGSPARFGVTEAHRPRTTFSGDARQGYPSP